MGTDVLDFTANLTPSQFASIQVYESDGTTLKTGSMQTGDKVEVSTILESVIYDVNVNAIGVYDQTTLDNNLLSSTYKYVVFLNNINVNNTRYINRTVIVDGDGYKLTFDLGELIIGHHTASDSIVAQLENLEVTVHNPKWRTPASAYGIVVHRGTMIADNIVVDLKWEGVDGAAPAGISTHYGASPGDHVRLGWTVEAVVTNSIIKVYSNSLNPYGFYASAGSTVTITNTMFEVSRLNTATTIQGIALGLQNELPPDYYLVPGVQFLFPDITFEDNTATGNTSHAIMVYRKYVPGDDVEAKAIIDQILLDNPGLPGVGVLLPNMEIYPDLVE